MANSVTVQIGFSVTANGVTVSQNVQNSTTTMAGDEFIANSQIIGTSCEAITVGDVSTIGYVLVKNLDSTNYVEFSVDNANAQKFMKVLAGDIAIFKAASATFYATANTANCKVLIMAAEL